MVLYTANNYYQLNFQNIIIMFCLELCYSMEKYITMDATILLSAEGTTYFQTKL